MTRFVESTITFPYKRSLGPVVGAFMTALTEKRILGIRSGDVGTGASHGVGPGHRSRAGPRVRRSGAGGHSRVVDVGANALDAAPPRPSLRLRPGPAGRRHHAASPCGRRRCAGGHGRGHAGGSPLARHAGGSHRRHHLLRPRRDAGDRGRGHRRGGRTGDPHGLPGLDHLSEPGTRGRRPGHRGLAGPPTPRPALSGLCPGVCRRPGLLPRRRHRARAGLRGRPAPYRDDHQLRHRHAGALPGPDRDRAVRPGLRPPRRHRRHHPLFAGDRACRPTRYGSASGSTRCGLRPPRRATRRAAWPGTSDRSSVGYPTGSPIRTIPTS